MAKSRKVTKSKAAAKPKKVVKKTAAKAKKSPKHLYFFGDGKAQGRADMKNLLGGKGANLAEMTSLGMTKRSHPNLVGMVGTVATLLPKRSGEPFTIAGRLNPVFVFARSICTGNCLRPVLLQHPNAGPCW